MNIPVALPSLLIILPFLGVLFSLFSQEDENHPGRNIYNVVVFTVIANIVLLFRIFMVMDVTKSSLQLMEKFNWLEQPDINLILGIDIFSGLLILAVHVALLAGLAASREIWYRPKNKSLGVFILVFLGLLTGFLLAADIFSFYLFFEALLLPALMLTGMFGGIKKNGVVYRFFIYNFLGALCLLAGTMMLFAEQGDASLASLHKIDIKTLKEYFIWGAFFIAFLSRIPVWPFHSYLAAVASGVKNPLLFIINNLLPLTGIYGFIRFLPKSFSDTMLYWVVGLEIIGVITMAFIALIGFINKESRYKLFAYVSVCYIMYLLSAFSKSPMALYNIGFSFFAFILVTSALAALLWKISQKAEESDVETLGYLNRVPRLRFIYGFMTFAAVGLPFSALFLNNFLIIGRLFKNGAYTGLIVVFSLLLVYVSLLGDYFRLSHAGETPQERHDEEDLQGGYRVLMWLLVILLLMSFIRPLWLLEL